MQWWFQSQSVKLATEAEAIRDGLLQESFSMRRTLESLADRENLSTQESQEWLKTLEQLHYSLLDVSDRLVPPHIEHSLPLAIKWLSQSWQKTNPQLKIETHLPTDWGDELTHSLVVIRVVDELLRITLTAFTAESLQISLKKHADIHELFLYISFPCLLTLISYSDLKELPYLRQTFRVLTSGQCFCHTEAFTVKWCFRWRDRENRLTK